MISRTLVSESLPNRGRLFNSGLLDTGLIVAPLSRHP